MYYEEVGRFCARRRDDQNPKPQFRLGPSFVSCPSTASRKNKITTSQQAPAGSPANANRSFSKFGSLYIIASITSTLSTAFAKGLSESERTNCARFWVEDLGRRARRGMRLRQAV